MKSEGGMRNSENRRQKDLNREDKKMRRSAGEMAESKAHGEQCGGGYWMDEGRVTSDEGGRGRIETEKIRRREGEWVRW